MNTCDRVEMPMFLIQDVSLRVLQNVYDLALLHAPYVHSFFEIAKYRKSWFKTFEWRWLQIRPYLWMSRTFHFPQIVIEDICHDVYHLALLHAPYVHTFSVDCTNVDVLTSWRVCGLSSKLDANVILVNGTGMNQTPIFLIQDVSLRVLQSRCFAQHHMSRPRLDLWVIDMHDLDLDCHTCECHGPKSDLHLMSQFCTDVFLDVL